MANTAATPQDASWEQQSLFAGFLSYLIPGLGQIVQGRTAKGVMFMVILLSMFIGGQALGDWRTVYIPRDTKENPLNLPRPLANIYNHRWHYAGQFWIGVAAWPALVQYYRWPEEEKGLRQDPKAFLNAFQAQRNRSQ